MKNEENPVLKFCKWGDDLIFRVGCNAFIYAASRFKIKILTITLKRNSVTCLRSFWKLITGFLEKKKAKQKSTKKSKHLRQRLSTSFEKTKQTKKPNNKSMPWPVLKCRDWVRLFPFTSLFFTPPQSIPQNPSFLLHLLVDLAENELSKQPLAVLSHFRHAGSVGGTKNKSQGPPVADPGQSLGLFSKLSNYSALSVPKSCSKKALAAVPACKII